MLHVPAGPQFEWRLSSRAGVRPSANFGTSVTPGNNTKGSWAQLLAGAAVLYDVWEIWINIHGGQVSAAARDIIVDIGIDTAGGTSYTVHIPDLIGSAAAFFSTGINAVGGGHTYYFPLYIPAGSSIAARASVNSATVGTVRAWVRLYGKPRFPELAPRGDKVVAYGITAASSRGTIVTPGTTSEGSYVSLGTTSLDHWWWQLGMGVNDATTNPLWLTGDLAFGTVGTKVSLIEDECWLTDTVEGIAKTNNVPAEYLRQVPSGSELFARAQCSGTLDAEYSMAAWGLT